MDARIIVFNDGLSDISRPVCRVRHLGTDFVFSYTVDGLSVGNCCVGAQYYCYSVDGGNSWEQLVAGGIIRWPDSYEDYKISGETLYDFFVNPQPETTMRDEQISRALDRLKTIL